MADGVVILPAYVDEAEARGLARDLTPERDHEFGLMCALLFEPNRHAKAVQDFTPPFEAFRSAMPAGAKLHIRDAFRPGNEAWKPVAETVREQYLQLIETTSLTESHSLAGALRQFGPSLLLRAEARFDSAASSLVPLDNAGDERVLSFGFSRQGLFQHLDDVARGQ